MKKIYVAMAVLGTVLLSSCVQEKNFKNIKVGENELAFVMEGVATRSAEAAPAVKGITIPMRNVLGDGVFLEETIEELNPGVATKGAPAKVWAGLTTYYDTDSIKVVPMNAGQILQDCRMFVDSTKAEGVVLFRYGLGGLPDLNGLWNK